MSIKTLADKKRQRIKSLPTHSHQSTWLPSCKMLLIFFVSIKYCHKYYNMNMLICYVLLILTLFSEEFCKMVRRIQPQNSSVDGKNSSFKKYKIFDLLRSLQIGNERYFRKVKWQISLEEVKDFMQMTFVSVTSSTDLILPHLYLNVVFEACVRRNSRRNEELDKGQKHS